MLYHLALIVALPFYLMSATPSLSLIIASLALLFLSGISISAGYHRFYAHKAYTPNKIVESVLLFFSTMAMQGSALRWSHEHRVHHRFTDQEGDPHSIKKGFWYAHMLWLFKRSKPIDESIVQDLAKNRFVLFQHRYYVALMILTNLAAFAFVGWLTKDWIGAFILSWLARIFLLHHFTWFINSLAHTWGAKTYSGEQSAVDNYIIALLTFGEGYHNYHHVFASDYRNGIKWYHFDPSKWLLWALSKIGLVKDLKKMSPMAIKKIIIIEDKKILIEKLRESNSSEKAALEMKVNEISERIMFNVSQLNEIMQKYAQSKERFLKKQAKEFSASLNTTWEEWKRLSRQIMRLPSI